MGNALGEVDRLYSLVDASEFVCGLKVWGPPKRLRAKVAGKSRMGLAS